MSSQPTGASKTPFAFEVQSGKDYYWCSCGRSSTQPLCDGQHQGTSFKPEKYTASEDKTVYVCGCGQSATMMFCDGAHKRL